MYRTMHNFFIIIKNPKTHQKPAGNPRTGFLEVSGRILDVPLLTGPHGTFFSRKATNLKFCPFEYIIIIAVTNPFLS